MKAETRELGIADLSELLELYTHLHKQDEPAPSETILAETWQRICADPQLAYYGLFEDEQLVSSACLSIILNLTRGCKPYGLIENVVTHSAFRRKGYGNAVLERCLTHAWEHSCYKVMLLTGRKSEAVFRFYESAGFERNAKQGFVAYPTCPA